MNLKSSKQLGILLYDMLKLPRLKTTPGGKPSTSKSTLTALAHETHHPIFELIFKHRDISKILGTYVNRWLNKRDENDRVHFYINQTATVSGRSGSDSQQIPKRTKTADLIRRAIVARKGCTLIEADYSQLEPRILAHLSGDKKLIKVFMDKVDIYRATVSAVKSIPLEQVTTEDRDLGKVIVLANNYGQTAWGLARKLGIEEEGAQTYLDNYFNHYSGVKVWRMETIDRARRLGFTTTLLGRRSKMSEDIALPPVWKNRYGKWQDVNKWRREASEREASNRPIQGSSQDIIKRAMRDIFARLSGESRLLMMVHDSLLFEIPTERVANSIPIIRQLMENAIPLCVPIPVEIKIGSNLAEMEKV